MKYSKFLFVFIIVLTLSCNKDTEFGSTKSSGGMQVQGMSTYMYGTHILTDNAGKTLYALRSKTVDLDKYNNKNVEIKGNKIKGYPVDGGPEYLDVSCVK